MVALLILVVSVSAFAGSISFDTGLGFGFGSEKIKIDSTTSPSQNISWTELPINISYRQEIKDSVGVVGTFGVKIPLSKKINNNSVSTDNNPTAFNFAVKATYELPIQKKLSFVSALGIDFSYATKTTNSVVFTNTKFGLASDLIVEYEATKNTSIRGGLNIGIPLFENQKASNSFSTLKSSISGFRMSVAPFIGVAYQF